jgi:FkbM family methyltransferase
LPDWKALKVPVLSLADFLGVPRPFVKPYILARKVKRQLYLRLLKSPEMISTIYDYKLCLPLKTKGIGHSLAAHGFRELDHRYLIQKLLKPNSIVFDLGANIGYYVVMYGRLMNNSGFIYAIEPDPRNIEYLRRNTALNGMTPIVRIDQIAISDHDGTASFHLANAANLSGLEVSRLPRSYAGCIDVQVRDLGRYLGLLPHTIEILRMDIEGHEVQALGSLANRAEQEKSIRWAPKRIIFEGHAWEYSRSGQNNMRPVIERLFRLGYRARYLCNAMEHFSPIRSRGYTPEVVIDVGFRYYGIYENVKNDDAVQLISEEPAITTICLERNGP